MRLIFPIGQALMGIIGIYAFWNMLWAMQIIAIIYLFLIVLFSLVVEVLGDKFAISEIEDE